MKRLLLVAAIPLSACSVFNPNPGETEADTLIQRKQYQEALAIIEPQANEGIPWAQLRLGIAWEYGQGQPKNSAEALRWYRATAVQSRDLPWADGIHLISAGEEGFFNQNNDARVAQYLVARLYAEGRKDIPQDLPEAWLWIQHVEKQSEGKDILFCCENSKLDTQKIKAERISSLKQEIESKLQPDALEKLRAQAVYWRPTR